MQMRRAVESEKARKVLKGIRRVEEKNRRAHTNGALRKAVCIATRMKYAFHQQTVFTPTDVVGRGQVGGGRVTSKVFKLFELLGAPLYRPRGCTQV